ncbi:MAG: Csu type fimbrial protein [Geminicoccaceae bacterium]
MARANDFRMLIGAAGLAGVTALAGPVLAQSSDTLTVQANVGGECTVTGATLDFGAYTGTQKDVDVPIGFNCNAPTNIAISMDGGATGDPNGRLMFNGDFSSQILYELYRNSARTQLWGVFPEDSEDFTSATTGNPTVFGRIPGGQTPLPGSYADSVIITLTTN